ncbi:hypothetical protein ACFQ0D_02375 [Micromonospora zhanjiangensis]
MPVDPPEDQVADGDSGVALKSPSPPAGPAARASSVPAEAVSGASPSRWARVVAVPTTPEGGTGTSAVTVPP